MTFFDVPLDVRMWSEDLGYIPKAQTAGANGLDLLARIEAPLTMWPGHFYEIQTGLHVEIPPMYVGLVCPRSGLAWLGIRSGNAPGVIDSDYRGEVKAMLWNSTNDEFVIAPGDRVAQLVIVPCPSVRVKPVAKLEDLSLTSRGEGGFGSTGR